MYKKKIKITDHLGHEFDSKRDMCKAYNINYSAYNSRIGRGWTQEKALTFKVQHKDNNGPQKNKIITDHLGNQFKSISEMCRFYHIPYYLYKHRVKSGWTQEKALTGNLHNRNGEPSNYRMSVVDHLGNPFRSIVEMCKHYNVHPNTYASRIKKGCTKKEALTGPSYNYNRKARSGKSVTDHLGNQFASITEMCKYHNIGYYTYEQRIRRGHTLEEALTEQNKCKSHRVNI